jgi:galactokinase
LQQLIERCERRFRQWTGLAPEMAASAPGRVNIIGEHTDYNGGFVLPMAIGRWCVVMGSRIEGERCRVLADDIGESAEFEVRGSNASGLPPWARYVAGSFWELRESASRAGRGWIGGLEMVLCADVPMGAGLSSSAAVEVGVGGIVNGLFGLGMTPMQIALAGQGAEHRHAGVPCGIMDQTASACSLKNRLLLIDCASGEARPASFPVGAEILVADSGVRRSLATGEYAKRRAACERAARALGVASLREADAELLERGRASLEEEALRCARHVIGENARVLRFVEAAERRFLGACGRLMRESHQSLRYDFRVSCPEVDEMVEAAMAVRGVLGSRMTGAGFGGCTVTLCERGAGRKAARVIGELTRARGAAEPFVAWPEQGAQAWRV